MKISVSETVKAKNPKLYKKLPKWIIRYLERIIHQDEINDILEKYGHLSSIDFAQEYFKYLQVTVNVVNEENIPKKGRYIMACNHPLGGLDGVALISLCGQYRRDIKFPVNDLLMYLEPLREVFVPINKHGKTGTDAVSQFNQAFESDDLILYFPAGLCSRKYKGIIRDPAWKKTVITKAKQTKRDIVPVFFDGKNSEWFYNLANFRKKIGLKANIEMLYLPNEMFKQKGATFTVTFGTPIPYTTFDSSKNDKLWATWLQEQVYQLKQR